MYQLFYSPGTCSMAVHVLLNELGQKFELLKADLSETPRSPALMKFNPRGQVPVLVVDGKPLREGAAILSYLCETHKSPLLPASGWERAKAQEWLAFANSTLHPAYGRLFFLIRQLGEKWSENPVFITALGMVQKHRDDIEQELQDNATTELEKLSAALKAEGFAVETSVRRGRASDEICTYAQEHSISIIAIGTHGRSGFEHFLFGSTTERVLRKAPCPVLSVRLDS